MAPIRTALAIPLTSARELTTLAGFLGNVSALKTPRWQVASADICKSAGDAPLNACNSTPPTQGGVRGNVCRPVTGSPLIGESAIAASGVLARALVENEVEKLARQSLAPTRSHPLLPLVSVVAAPARKRLHLHDASFAIFSRSAAEGVRLQAPGLRLLS
jgi:hypothetical protein